MNYFLFFIFLFFFNAFTSLPAFSLYAPSSTKKTHFSLKMDESILLQKFAFGSCNRESAPQPLWPTIKNLKPQFFMWVGDAVYADSNDPQVIAEKYQIQRQQKDYAALVTSTPILGTWDDHDYGGNNQGRHWPLKDIVQKYFLDFIGESLTSPRREQKGIYISYLLGPPGQQIKLILLDTRYFKTTNEDPADDILGESQWEWLEKELTDSSAQAHFLVSSFSVLSPQVAAGEQWIDYPRSWERFEKIVTTAQPKGLMILTGDRHFGGMLSKELPDGKNYYEIMSSGLTHLPKSIVKAVLKKVYGEENSLFAKNFGFIELFWNQNSRLNKMQFTLHTDASSTQTTWQKKFLLVNDQWQLQKIHVP